MKLRLGFWGSGSVFLSDIMLVLGSFLILEVKFVIYITWKTFLCYAIC